MIEPHRVGAPPFDQRHRLDDVALGLATSTRRRRSPGPGSSARGNGSTNPTSPGRGATFVKNRAVEQVQDRVLDAARVLADRHPAVDVLAPERPVLVRRASSTGRSTSDESTNVSIVSVSRRPRPRRSGTRRLHHGRVPRERRLPARLEVDVVGQQDRQLGRRARPPRRTSWQWMIGIGAPQYR